MIRYLVTFLETGNQKEVDSKELALLGRWNIPVKVQSLLLDLTGLLLEA